MLLSYSLEIVRMILVILFLNDLKDILTFVILIYWQDLLKNQLCVCVTARGREGGLMCKDRKS